MSYQRPAHWWYPHTVYELVDADGTVFYVGSTSAWRTRKAQHQKRFGDRLVKMRQRGRYATRHDARVKEARLIRELQPAENITVPWVD